MGATRRDVEARPLQLGVVARHLELFLGGADADVVGRHLGQQRHEDVVVVGHRGEQLGVRRLDATPELAPEVELPRNVEACQELIEAAVGWLHDDVLARDHPALATNGVLRLGEERADGDPPPCLPLQHPDARGLQRRVLPVRVNDQVGHDRVAERFPPRADRFGGRRGAVGVPGDPAGRERCRRTLVVGSDHHAPRRDDDRKENDAALSGMPHVVTVPVVEPWAAIAVGIGSRV